MTRLDPKFALAFGRADRRRGADPVSRLALPPVVTPPVRTAGGPCPPDRLYRGWEITWDYGYFTATGPNYDASYEGEEDGWVDNGHRVQSRTREGLIEEVDAWFEDHSE